MTSRQEHRRLIWGVVLSLGTSVLLFIMALASLNPGWLGPRVAATTPGSRIVGAPDPLAGTAWKLIEMNGKKVITEISLEFLHDGTLRGQACNYYYSPYAISGGTLSDMQVSSTLMACVASYEEETDYFDALRHVSGFVLAEERQLTLLDAAGTPLLVFSFSQRITPLPPTATATPTPNLQGASDLAGTRWALSQFDGQQTMDDITLNFWPHKVFGGEIGCNEYVGLFQPDSALALFVDIKEKAFETCQQESSVTTKYFEALKRVRRFRIAENNQLTLEDGSGTPVLIYTFLRYETPAPPTPTLTPTP